MLIIIPSSESKRTSRGRGRPVELESLSFPTLTPTRAAILDALIATSTRDDALRRLQVGPALAEEVERNARLRELPAHPCLAVYTGVVHGGLDATSLSPAARRRANRSVVVASALWGLLRPSDRIPSYRLHICSHLIGLDGLEATWRKVLPAVLAEAAGPRGVVLDLRSSSYQAAGRPTGLGDRTVTLQVQGVGDGSRLGTVITKRVRGEVARHLLESGEHPANPRSLAEILAERWPARLDRARTPGTVVDLDPHGVRLRLRVRPRQERT